MVTRRDLLSVGALNGLSLTVAPLPIIADVVPAAGQRDLSSLPVQSPKSAESILDPDVPIIDAHHHLWFMPEALLRQAQALDDPASLHKLFPMFSAHSKYLSDEFMADATSGHNIRASVYVEVGTMYRTGGQEELKSVGEVEFANGIAAMAASKLFGDVRVCTGIVGNVNLSLGDAVEGVLTAHIQAGGGRYRGVRDIHRPVPYIIGKRMAFPDLLGDKKFRAGFRRLHQLGLSSDIVLSCLKIPELVDLARTFPETQIIFMAAREGQPDLALWRKNMQGLESCPNVAVKLGGHVYPAMTTNSWLAQPPFTSEKLAIHWKPHMESCIEALGVNRCMFVSDLPSASGLGTYSVCWNAYKRVIAGASEHEKAALFSGTAAKVYRLNL